MRLGWVLERTVGALRRSTEAIEDRDNLPRGLAAAQTVWSIKTNGLNYTMKQNSSSRRGRGRAQGKRGGSQPGRSSVNGNRAEPKLKGNPKQLLDKYKTLARDAIQAGDRILAENYFQHADHYQRLVNERTQRRPEHQPRQQQQQQQPNFADDGFNGAQAAEPPRNEKKIVAGESSNEPAPVDASDAVGSGDEVKVEPAPAPRPRARRPRKPAPAPKADGDQPEVEI